MAIQNKPRPMDLCPTCYKEGKEVQLKYQPGAKYSHFCGNGHQWDDRDTLSAALMEMSAKVRAANPQKNEDEEKSNNAAAANVFQNLEGKIVIDRIDKERLESILGKFGDSSSLFGLIFAFNEQIKDLQEKLKRAEDKMAVSKVRKIEGDYPLEIQIPERHVQPLKDVAESGGMSLERYIQAQAVDAMDNGWWA